MPTPPPTNPLANQPRLHLQIGKVLRAQAAEAVHLAREVTRDPDLLDALEGMVARVRDTARTLGLAHVERACALGHGGYGGTAGCRRPAATRDRT
jgi:hypothetical protein